MWPMSRMGRSRKLLSMSADGCTVRSRLHNCRCSHSVCLLEEAIDARRKSPRRCAATCRPFWVTRGVENVSNRESRGWSIFEAVQLSSDSLWLVLVTCHEATVWTPNVVGLFSQPFRATLPPSLSWHSHVPDLFIVPGDAGPWLSLVRGGTAALTQAP